MLRTRISCIYAPRMYAYCTQSKAYIITSQLPHNINFINMYLVEIFVLLEQPYDEYNEDTEKVST